MLGHMVVPFFSFEKPHTVCHSDCIIYTPINSVRGSLFFRESPVLSFNHTSSAQTQHFPSW